MGTGVRMPVLETRIMAGITKKALQEAVEGMIAGKATDFDDFATNDC